MNARSNPNLLELVQERGSVADRTFTAHLFDGQAIG